MNNIERQKTFRELIREERKKRNMTKKNLADALNIDNSIITKWEKSTRIPSDEILKDLSILFNIDYVILKSSLNVKETAQIAYYQKASISKHVTAYATYDDIELSENTLKHAPEDYFFIQSEDNSMEAHHIIKNALLLCYRSMKFREGNFYVILVKENFKEKMLVRQLIEIKTNELIFLAGEPFTEPTTIDKEKIKLIGRVEKVIIDSKDIFRSIINEPKEIIFD